MLLLFLKATLKSNQLVNYQKNEENKYLFSKIYSGGWNKMDITGSIASHLYATHTKKMKAFWFSLSDFRD